MTKYPDEFYIIHRLFTGDNFAFDGEYGDLGDGPIDTATDVIDVITEAYKGEDAPTTNDLRVWHIKNGTATLVTDTFCNILGIAK